MPIKCPYCGGEMKLRTLGSNKNKISFYECSECLSRSPQTWNEATAKGMALMRFTKNKRSVIAG